MCAICINYNLIISHQWHALTSDPTNNNSYVPYIYDCYLSTYYISHSGSRDALVIVIRLTAKHDLRPVALLLCVF